MNELREELAARNMSPKGLRLQLIARLSKLLKQEQEAEEEKARVPNDADVSSDEKKKTDEEKKNKEKEVKNFFFSCLNKNSLGFSHKTFCF